MKKFLIGYLSATAILIGSAATSATAAWTEEHKLLASDGTANDVFGESVAISGNTVIVGNSKDAGNGTNSGSAYLFVATTGSEIAKLTALDGGERYEFGFSVAISGNTAIVGSPAVDNDSNASGSAYLFDATTGTQIFKLTASDGAARDGFGESVAISGNTAIVGRSMDDDNGNDSGSAYLFNATTGVQTDKLLASDGAAGDDFGLSVAISGNTAIVGSPGDDSDKGGAYLFNATTGTQTFKLAASDGAALDRFGVSVAISGNTAIVGSPGDDSGKGGAYLFNATTGGQLAKLTVSDGAADDYFGASVAISGNTAIVGSLGDDSGKGGAYLFNATTGTQIAKLLASDGAADDLFGWSVAISGNTAIIGSPGDDDYYGDYSGSAYLFASTTSEPPEEPQAPGVPDVLSGYELLGVLALLVAARRRWRKA